MSDQTAREPADFQDSPNGSIVLQFVACINSLDLNGFAKLITDDHVLTVFAEPPVVGREKVLEGWRAYAIAHPNYRIYPHRLRVHEDKVAVLGHTTGSHLGLPDAEESKLTLIWLARLRDGKIASWTLFDDTAENRATFELDT